MFLVPGSGLPGVGVGLGGGVGREGGIGRSLAIAFFMCWTDTHLLTSFGLVLEWVA